MIRSFSAMIFAASLIAPLAIGCSSDSSGGSGSNQQQNGPRVKIGGKADSPTAADCAGTAVDANGVCRRDNGQFAPSVCCAKSSECANATIDAQGQCRDTENGQFVPAACCDALCEGAKIINNYCRYEDTGRFALAACCADQCFDLQPPAPEEAPAGSCASSCGDQGTGGSCWCDAQCVTFGDCCADFSDSCPELTKPEPTAQNSCAGACGNAAPSGNCWCDEACATLGDCCGDKVASCGGEGSDAIVACEKDDCEGTALDDSGVCRKTATGQYALSACCAPNRCANANLEIASNGQALCRDTENGQFIPMNCCDVRCENAELDRNGICRKTDSGQFADPACCADQCFVAQQSGAVSSLEGCNGTQQAPQ